MLVLVYRRSIPSKHQARVALGFRQKTVGGEVTNIKDRFLIMEVVTKERDAQNQDFWL